MLVYWPPAWSGIAGVIGAYNGFGTVFGDSAVGKSIPFNDFFMGISGLETREKVFHGTGKGSVFLWMETDVFLSD